MSERGKHDDLPPGVRIRGYERGDGEPLRALWTEAGFRLIGDDDAGLEAFADRNPGSLLIAERHGRIVASAMGGWDGRRGLIHHVATCPDLQRLGLATILVARVETILRDGGCRRCLVIVEEGNEAASAFWLAQGYDRRPTSQLGKTL